MSENVDIHPNTRRACSCRLTLCWREVGGSRYTSAAAGWELCNTRPAPALFPSQAIADRFRITRTTILFCFPRFFKT